MLPVLSAGLGCAATGRYSDAVRYRSSWFQGRRKTDINDGGGEVHLLRPSQSPDLSLWEILTTRRVIILWRMKVPVSGLLTDLFLMWVHLGGQHSHNILSEFDIFLTLSTSLKDLQQLVEIPDLDHHQNLISGSLAWTPSVRQILQNPVDRFQLDASCWQTEQANKQAHTGGIWGYLYFIIKYKKNMFVWHCQFGSILLKI